MRGPRAILERRRTGGRQPAGDSPPRGVGRLLHSWSGRILWIVVFVVCGLRLGVQRLHFDTLERAYLLEHPLRYLHSWNGTPRSQFLFFAHVLELPLAYALGGVFLGVPGLRALLFFEVLCGALAVLAVGWIVRFWGGGRIAVLFARAGLAATVAFWKLATGGEEKMAALASQLLFLVAFWNALSRPRGGALAGLALFLSILVHLTGVVFVPFAALALWILPAAWKERRRPLATALVAASLAAGLAYVVIAATTNEVRTPGQFIHYITYYHDPHGNNFFEPTGADHPGEARAVRILHGWADFLAAGRAGYVVLGMLVVLLGSGVVLALRSRSGIDSDLRRTFLAHTGILTALWTTHFVFFQPMDYESWTLPVALAFAACAVLWEHRRRWLLAFAVLPVALLAANLGTMKRLHQPHELEDFCNDIVSVSRPGDVVLLMGGRANGELIKGSYWMRYFLAKVHGREIVSLYDVFGVGEGDYWPQWVRHPDDVQAALDRGKRAFTPAFMAAEYDTLVALGHLDIRLRPVSDFTLEVLSFQRPPPPTAP